MKIYHELLANILQTGVQKGDRTGTGTRSIFGAMMRFPLDYDLWPVPTTRKVAYMKAIEELEWFIKGMTHTSWLKERDNHIWDEWAGQDSGIGPMYGEQWRNWTSGLTSITETDEEQLRNLLKQQSYGINPDTGYVLGPEHAIAAFKKFLAEKNKPYSEGGRNGIDQLTYIVSALKNNPDDRRMVVSAWNAALLPDGKLKPHENADAGRMALAPCHAMWQVWTAPLTDLEILTETIKSEAWARHFVEEAFKYLTLEHAMRTIETRLHIATRRYYEGGALTAEGVHKVQEYRNADRPIRKLSLMLYARKQVRH